TSTNSIAGVSDTETLHFAYPTTPARVDVLVQEYVNNGTTSGFSGNYHTLVTTTVLGTDSAGNYTVDVPLQIGSRYQARPAVTTADGVTHDSAAYGITTAIPGTAGLPLVLFQNADGSLNCTTSSDALLFYRSAGNTYPDQWLPTTTNAWLFSATS